MKKVFLSLVGWALISSLAGVATVAAAPRQGASELQVSGGFFHAEDTDFGNLNLDLSYGYYLSPGWQLGLRQALNYLFVDDASDQWIATTAPFINYHFRVTDIIVPYLGGFIGAAWNDRDVTGTLGPQVGVKLFVHEQTFVNLGYRYEWFWDKFERINNESDNGNHIFNIGVGFTWAAQGAAQEGRKLVPISSNPTLSQIQLLTLTRPHRRLGVRSCFSISPVNATYCRVTLSSSDMPLTAAVIQNREHKPTLDIASHNCADSL